MLNSDPFTFVPTAPFNENFYMGEVVNSAMLEHFENGRVIGRTFPNSSVKRIVEITCPSADATGFSLMAAFQAGAPVRYYRNWPATMSQFVLLSNETGYDDLIAHTVGDETTPWYNNVIQQVELTFKGIANVL